MLQEEMQLQANALSDLWPWHQGHIKYCPAPSTSYDHMHLQRLKLLRPMEKEQMHLQENTVFDLDFWAKVTGDVAQYHLHYVALCTCKV